MTSTGKTRLDDRVSIEELRTLFAYDPEDGALTRKKSRRPMAKCRNPFRFARKQVGGESVFYVKFGYRQVRIRGRTYQVHHICWALRHGAWPGEGQVVDHIDGDPVNNRADNLQLLPIGENCLKPGKLGFLAKQSLAHVINDPRFPRWWQAIAETLRALPEDIFVSGDHLRPFFRALPDYGRNRRRSTAVPANPCGTVLEALLA